MPLRLILQTVLLTAVAASGRNGFAQDQTNNANDRAVAEWTAVYRINLEENLRWMLARERAKSVDVEAGRKIAVPRVGVFADFGVWHLGARSIVESLEREDIACQVIDRTLLVASKLKTFDAVILPGGWAPFQLTALDESQQTTLKKFVSGGGRCIGVCAGAYLVSRIVRWEAKDYPYPLELFDGIAAGPVSGLADWPVQCASQSPRKAARGVWRRLKAAVSTTKGARTSSAAQRWLRWHVIRMAVRRLSASLSAKEKSYSAACISSDPTLPTKVTMRRRRQSPARSLNRS